MERDTYFVKINLKGKYSTQHYLSNNGHSLVTLYVSSRGDGDKAIAGCYISQRAG